MSGGTAEAEQPPRAPRPATAQAQFGRDEVAHLQVILGPAVGEGGYELVDVSGEEPWASLR